MKRSTAKNSSESPTKKQQVAPELRGKRYNLRSSLDGVRVLRSMSNGKSKSVKSPVKPAKTKSPAKSVSALVRSVQERKKRKKKAKRSPPDEFLRIRKRVQYLLTRMNYEQNLIDAYSGEGWKGQSTEKIRPEKELERAKSEILRCKLRIRDLFYQLDLLLSEGKLEESLFDTEGQISSEDIFCAKCGSKDLSANNDIILCDGICDRGFHQKCLNPPLLSENIPSGDEGWLCPACDCKVDCFDLLNESQGSGLNIENTWENVFPEAAANGGMKHDDSAFPSDESEDDDYDPDSPAVNEEDEEAGYSSGESESISLSEESWGPEHKTIKHNMDLPSEDSEDDDYDPDAREPDEITQKAGLSSDESDFTSDSDDFCAVIVKGSGVNEISEALKPAISTGEVTRVLLRKKSMINSERNAPLGSDSKQENGLPVSGKRQREQLDDRKLYDETYGKTSSDSSDDEDWSDINSSKEQKKDASGKGSLSARGTAQSVANHKDSRRVPGKLTEVGSVTNSESNQPQTSQMDNEFTPLSLKSNPNLLNDSVAERHCDSHGCNSKGESSTTTRRGLGKATLQRLHESFKQNQYPNRATKESLAEELGITVKQVDKWFGNARHSMRVSNKMANQGVVSPGRVMREAPNQPVVNNAAETQAEQPSQAEMTPNKELMIYSNIPWFTTPNNGVGLAISGSNHIGTNLDNGQISVSNESKTRTPDQAGNKAGFEGTTTMGDQKTRLSVDIDRQKAIARELRRRRMRM